MCDHKLGSLPCVNDQPHPGGGRGCVHIHGGHEPDEPEQE